MKKLEGSCKIDGVEIGEISVVGLGPAPVVSVKYALCNTTTGERFGAGNRNVGWSAETMEALQALLEALERDVSGTLSDGDTTGSGVVDPRHQDSPFPGL